MTTPNYNCSSFSGIDVATCTYYQDIAITHYYFIGYLEILLIFFLTYLLLYKILWRWIFKKFFIF